ncbi:MAG: PQQ-dependent sugar dehydrogenase [Gemmatimonadetes bacterium]|nr:PQQ-dependent sugar dehydrogenase [Gemmatimonadota bacterium]
MAIDPAFAANGWLYLFYSKAGAEPKNVLARYTMRGDSVDTSNAIVMLEVVVQREQCCHTGGSIAFDAKGNLFPSTGDNSNPFMNGYASSMSARGACRGTRRSRRPTPTTCAGRSSHPSRA